MARHENWPERLHAYIEARGKEGFAWGRNDCALFTCDWIKEATGYDPAKDFRGKYSTAAGSLRALKKYGRGNLYDTFDALMEKRLSPLAARRGDAVAAPVGPDGEIALGIVTGSKAVFLGLEGLVSIPTAKAAMAWEVA